MSEPLLDEEDLSVLDEALQRLEENEENLARAEQAGIDISPVRQRFDASKAQIRRIKTAFFPGR